MMTKDWQQIAIGSLFFGMIYSSRIFYLRKSWRLRDRRDSKGITTHLSRADLFRGLMVKICQVIHGDLQYWRLLQESETHVSVYYSA